MKKSIYKKKFYSHFDRRKNIKEVQNWIENPDNIIHHGFMPFIHFEKKNVKYTATKGKEAKCRDLLYCSHIDAYIYQLYTHRLTKLYNERVKSTGINKCVIAYRNIFQGKCNIHFAHEVFSFIRKTKDCYIIVGDFTKFFDNLDHSYLKKQCCNLLDAKVLPEDYYKVFKSIIKYSYFELDDLMKLTDSKDIKEFNKRELALPTEQFREAKTKFLKKNKKNYGIPQGSPLSALFANVYMLDFDKAVNDFVTSNHGLYRRYSDDFIIVLPADSARIIEQWKYINKLRSEIPNLKLQPAKTKVFRFIQNTLTSCDTLLFPDVSDGKNTLDYLGFSFDGDKVSIRDKTVSKYYYRMYHKAKVVGLRKAGVVQRKPDLYGLYKTYSHFGANPHRGNQGNFITYVNRCIDVFGMDEKVHLVKQRHMKKINDTVKNPSKKRTKKKSA